jgi:hypothetical protein
MFNYDCVLAAVLLTSPIESPEVVPHLEVIQPTFLQLAIDAEVLDPREEQLLRGLSKDLAGDYRFLRQRYDSLLPAPSLEECDRFPSRRLVEDMLAFNRAYRKDLLDRMELDSHPTEQLRQAVQEVDQLHFLWTTVRDAKCSFYYVTVRRQSLQHLRELIGDEAFYRGELPPHVPLWCFPPLR